MIDGGLLVSHHTQHYIMSKILHFGLKYHLERLKLYIDVTLTHSYISKLPQHF